MAENQDPIPEPKWFWRRLYTFGVTIGSMAIVAFIVWRIQEGSLAGIAYGLIALVAWLATLYLVAPSADEIARIVARIASLKAGLALPVSVPPAAPGKPAVGKGPATAAPAPVPVRVPPAALQGKISD